MIQKTFLGSLAVGGVMVVLSGCTPVASTPDAPIAPRTDAPIAPGTDAPGTDAPRTDVPGSSSPTWSLIELPHGGQRVTGIHCSNATTCVVSTDGVGSVGHLYASDGASITETLLTGDTELGALVGVIGEPGFFGFSLVGDRLITRLHTGGDGWVWSTGDFTETSSWHVERVGVVTDAGASFGLNPQFGFGTDGTRWTQFRGGLIYGTSDAPGPTAAWRIIWSPRRTPPVPADIVARRAADPTLCDSDPGYSNSPRPVHAGYLSPDLAIALSPAHALNQDSSDPPGVCISTDGAQSFHLVPFPDAADYEGPTALTCVSHDHCVVMGGQTLSDGSSTYGYVSRDASMGAASTWSRITLPSFGGGTIPKAIFFAPDGAHGWAVGEEERRGFLWATSDGGETWVDLTASIRGLTTHRLDSGFALDASHVFVGGESDTLLAFR